MCYADTYTLTTAKADIDFTILAVAVGGAFGTTAVSATTVTQSTAACSSFTVYTLEYYNKTTKLWVDYNS